MAELAARVAMATDAKNARVEHGAGRRRTEAILQGACSPRTFGHARDVADFWLDRTAREAGVTKKESQYDYELVKDSRLVRVKGKVRSRDWTPTSGGSSTQPRPRTSSS